MKKCSVCKDLKPISAYHVMTAAKDGLYPSCKSCKAISNNTPERIAAKRLYQRSSEGKASSKRYRQSEAGKASAKRCFDRIGFCTYIAIFESGIYIGSGKKGKRKSQHLSGHSSIARKLGEKAKSVRELFYGTKEETVEVEDRLIRDYGIENLLNIRRGRKDASLS